MGWFILKHIFSTIFPHQHQVIIQPRERPGNSPGGTYHPRGWHMVAGWCGVTPEIINPATHNIKRPAISAGQEFFQHP